MRKLWSVLPLALCLLVAGCGGDPKPTAAPSATPTSIAGLHPSGMRVVRVKFCDLVPRASVRSALGARSTLSRSWRDGDPVPDAGRQVGHEFGCAWFAAHGRSARAWVFAQPVRPTFARTLVRRAGDEHGCRATPSTLFGKPSVLQTCRRSPGYRIRRAGLFGDTWLTCEVGGPGTRTGLRARADAWCLRVANSLNAG